MRSRKSLVVFCSVACGMAWGLQSGASPRRTAKEGAAKAIRSPVADSFPEIRFSKSDSGVALSVADLDLERFCRYLRNVQGLNVLAAKDLVARLTGSVEERTLERGLESLAKGNGLGIRWFGKIALVEPALPDGPSESRLQVGVEPFPGAPIPDPSTAYPGVPFQPEPGVSGIPVPDAPTAPLDGVEPAKAEMFPQDPSNPPSDPPRAPENPGPSPLGSADPVPSGG